MRQLTATALLVFLACISAAQEPPALEPVRLQLKWTHQFQFAGFYAALEKGYYAEAGLDVTIIEGAPDTDFIGRVVNGEAEYGVEMPDLLLRRNAGDPVVVLAAIFQHSPIALISLAEAGIASPHDLVGKRVMLRATSNAAIRAMILHEGIDLSEIDIQPHSFDVGDLLRGNTDAMSAYYSSYVPTFSQQSIEVDVLQPLTYGIDFYGDCLFTSEEELRRYPDRVRAFRAASLRGWAYAMNNTAELASLIHEKYAPSHSVEWLMAEAEEMKPLLLHGYVETGHMNRGRWEHIADTFVLAGLLDADYSLDGFIYDPNPGHDTRWLWVAVAIAGGAACIGLTVAVALFLYNKALDARVRERTSELHRLNRNLQSEVRERELAELQLRASEDRFARIFDGSSNAIALTDVESGQLVAVNATWEAVTGLDKEYVIGKQSVDLGLWADPEARAKSIEILRNDGRLRGVPIKLNTPRGGIHCVLSAEQIETAEGIYFLWEFQDVTDRVQAEEDREKLRSQLVQAQKMEAIGQLAGGVAHDFNNLIQVIAGYTDILTADLAAHEGAEEPLREITKATQRAAQLVSQLLAYSRRQILRPETLDLNEVIEELLKMVRRLIGENIKLDFIPGRTLGMIRADRGMLEQVIVNLAVNARDAIGGDGTLTLETTNVLVDGQFCAENDWASPGRYVLLTVSDTGCGMDSATLNHIFEPFFTTKPKDKGSGLGLAMVYGIVRQHEGMVRAYSEPGRGAAFKVYLPVSEQLARNVVARGRSNPAGGSETILLAEDDEAVRSLAVRILRQAGYQVLAARDGAEAVSLFEKHGDSIGLLLFDVVMPRLGGKEAYERIHAIRADIPVLFSSGYSENAVHTNFVLEDEMMLLQKPYASGELLDRIRQVLDNRLAP